MRPILPLLIVVTALALFGYAWMKSGPREDDGAGNGADAPDARGTYLTDEQRVRLFDLERADLLLGRALKPWTEAIRAKDRERIGAALASSFEGRCPIVPSGVERRAGGGLVFGHARLEGADAKTAETFLAWIMDLTSRFDRIDAVKFGRRYNSVEILEGPQGRAESTGTWRVAGVRDGSAPLEVSGKFRLRHRGMSPDAPVENPWIFGLELFDVSVVHAERPLFREITADTGIDVDGLHDNWRPEHLEKSFQILTGGIYLGDVNGDDHLDALVTDVHRTWLYIGKGDGSFVDSGWNPKVPERVYAALFDATGDGRVDVLLDGLLYEFDPRQGKPVPIEGATRMPNGDASLCDYDRDGLVDVYFRDSGRFYPGDQPRAFFDNDRIAGRENLLFRNLGGGKFEDVTALAKASGGFGRTFATTWFYADGDEWPDVFCANEFGRNALLINNGDGTFDDGPEIDAQFGGFSMGVTAGDLDDDGVTDLYVSNMYSKAGHRVYHHLDLDAYPPNVRRMFMASIKGNKYYRGRTGTAFDDWSFDAGVNEVGWGWSGAMADFDLNGRLDIYAPCGHSSADKSKPDG